MQNIADELFLQANPSVNIHPLTYSWRKWAEEEIESGVFTDCRFCVGGLLRPQDTVSQRRIGFFFIMFWFSNITFFLTTVAIKKWNPINFIFKDLVKIFLQPGVGGRKILKLQFSLFQFKISLSSYIFWFIPLAVLFPIDCFSVLISSFPPKRKENSTITYSHGFLKIRRKRLEDQML